MALFWPRLEDDTMLMVVAFLLLVAVPVHASVVGLGHWHTATPGTVDTALLERGAFWLLGAVLAIAVSQALQA